MYVDLTLDNATMDKFATFRIVDLTFVYEI
jgi:hypothetical protein